MKLPQRLHTTHVLIALNVLVFAAMLVAGGGEGSGFSGHTLLVFGANHPQLVQQGQWYRPFTSMFIHLNAIHLLMNMVALHQIGTPLEGLYGRARHALLYVVAGLVGSAASLVWHHGTNTVSAGASGAITGLIGAAAVASHLAGPAGKPLRDAMLRWLVTIFGFGLLIKADNAAHLGGLVGGAALGFAFRDVPQRLALRRRQPSDRKDTWPGVETLLLVALVAGTFTEAWRRRDEALSAAELVNLGVDRAREGKLDEAIALYRRALAQEPDDVTALYDLGLALHKRGDDEGARTALLRAVEIRPMREAYGLLVSVHTALGDSAAAEEARAAADSLPP